MSIAPNGCFCAHSSSNKGFCFTKISSFSKGCTIVYLCVKRRNIHVYVHSNVTMALGMIDFSIDSSNDWTLCCCFCGLLSAVVWAAALSIAVFREPSCVSRFRVSEFAATVSSCSAILWSILLNINPAVAFFFLALMFAAWKFLPPDVENLCYTLLADDDEDSLSVDSTLTVDVCNEDAFYWVMEELKQEVQRRKGCEKRPR